MIFCSNQRGKKSVIHHTHLWHMNSYFIWKELSQKLCCLWHFLPPVTKSSKTILKRSEGTKINHQKIKSSHNVIQSYQLAKYKLACVCVCERERERQGRKRDSLIKKVLYGRCITSQKILFKWFSLSTRDLKNSTKMKRPPNWHNIPSIKCLRKADASVKKSAPYARHLAF
jgi:hypothetical protein